MKRWELVLTFVCSIFIYSTTLAMEHGGHEDKNFSAGRRGRARSQEQGSGVYFSYALAALYTLQRVHVQAISLSVELSAFAIIGLRKCKCATRDARMAKMIKVIAQHSTDSS